MKPSVVALAFVLILWSGGVGRAGNVAVNAINALGIDLLHKTASTKANALLSP